MHRMMKNILILKLGSVFKNFLLLFLMFFLCSGALVVEEVSLVREASLVTQPGTILFFMTVPSQCMRIKWCDVTKFCGSCSLYSSIFTACICIYSKYLHHFISLPISSSSPIFTNFLAAKSCHVFRDFILFDMYHSFVQKPWHSPIQFTCGG